MKRLLIMRHAKSSWADSGLSDYDRPLNERGQRDAPRMASWLNAQGIAPDRIVASSAERAKQTAELLSESLDQAPQLDLTDEFYLAPPAVYLEFLKQLDDETKTAVFIGHNPGMEALVSMLSGEHEAMPTAAIGCFHADCESWGDFAADCECVALWRPKEIDD